MNARDELFRFLIGYIVILPESYLSSKYKCGDSTHVTQKIYYENFPLDKFDLLSSYLQKRIDRTILGRNMKAKNKKRYSTFEEFINK